VTEVVGGGSEVGCIASEAGLKNLTCTGWAEDLADAAWRSVRQWSGLDRDTVGKQLIRSADSVGANIAEGFGRGAGADNRRCVRIALGSLYETKHWLRRAYQRRLLRDDEIEVFRPMLDKLLPMLNAYLKSIGKRRAVPTPDLQPTTHD
jgi:four helix bundle protein